MAAEIQTQVSHRAYGRTNLEVLYSTLRIPDIQHIFGSRIRRTRDEKAELMRLIFVELHLAFMRPEVDEVSRELVSWCLAAIAFEMLYLQSLVYINKVQPIVEQFGYKIPPQWDSKEFI